MDLQIAIENPSINVFDIVTLKGGKFDVHTYRKPNETPEQFEDRDLRNLMFALKLKKK